ncbi:MAG: methyl-accepting chemotaxis protein, partial [Bacteroidales bacterium]|nr:methyl-accepting chemotaxis protein [Bacteroidales bacterium]
MKWFNSMKLGTGITVIIVTLVVICQTTMMVMLLLKFKDAYSGRLNNELHLQAEVNVEQLKNQMSGYDEKAHSLAQFFQNVMENVDAEDRRQQCIAMMRTYLETTPGVMSVWTVMEPNALDGRDAAFVNTRGHDRTGRFATAWGEYNGKTGMVPAAGYDDMNGIGAYYATILKTGQGMIFEPYLYPVNGANVYCSSICIPVKRNGTTVGVVGLSIDLGLLQQVADAIKPFEEGVSVIVSAQGMVVGHGLDASRVGKPLSQSDTYFGPHQLDTWAQAMANRRSYSCELEVPGLGHSRIQAVPMIVGDYAPWSLMVYAPTKVLLAPINGLRLYAWIAGCISALIVCIGTFILTKYMSKLIQLVVDIFNNMAKGNLIFKLPKEWHFVLKQENEIGQLCNAGVALNAKLSELVTEISNGVDSLLQASNHLNDGSQTVSQGASEQASSTEEISSSMEQMVANIQQNADNAQQANAITERINREVKNVSLASRESLESVREIASKIDVINDIAFQT